MFSGLVGVLFGYLVPINKYHVLKGAIYGVIVWFVIYGIVIMYKVPVLKDIPLASSLENTLASIIYGVILAIIMNYLIKHNIGRKE